jgi:hypothetical protein
VSAGCERCQGHVAPGRVCGSCGWPGPPAHADTGELYRARQRLQQAGLAGACDLLRIGTQLGRLWLEELGERLAPPPRRRRQLRRRPPPAAGAEPQPGPACRMLPACYGGWREDEQCLQCPDGRACRERAELP